MSTRRLIEDDDGFNHILDYGEDVLRIVRQADTANQDFPDRWADKVRARLRGRYVAQEKKFRGCWGMETVFVIFAEQDVAEELLKGTNSVVERHKHFETMRMRQKVAAALRQVRKSGVRLRLGRAGANDQYIKLLNDDNYSVGSLGLVQAHPGDGYEYTVSLLLDPKLRHNSKDRMRVRTRDDEEAISELVKGLTDPTYDRVDSYFSK